MAVGQSQPMQKHRGDLQAIAASPSAQPPSRVYRKIVERQSSASPPLVEQSGGCQNPAAVCGGLEEACEVPLTGRCRNGSGYASSAERIVVDMLCLGTEP